MRQYILLTAIIIIITAAGGVLFFGAGKNSAIVTEPDETIIAYRIQGNDIHSVKFQKDKSENNISASITTLPSDRLHIAETRGLYRIGSVIVNVQHPGLYRIFSYDDRKSIQFIAYDKTKDHPDILMAALAHVVSHGTVDDGLPHKDLPKKASSGSLFLTCGYVSALAQTLLSELGIENRIVTTLTLDEAWNEYDNGHTMIELYDRKHQQWILYDLSSNAYFTQDGKRLSFLDFYRQTRQGHYEINKISNEKKYNITTKDGFNLAFYMDYISYNEQTLRRWYRKMMQSIGIRHNNLYVFKSTGDNDHDRKIELYAPDYYKVIDKENFLRQFYRK